MADWYYAKGGKQFGPISSAQLKQMAQSGELTPDDLVFQEGGTQWVAASTVKGMFDRSGGGGGGGNAPLPRGGIAPRIEERTSGSFPVDDRDRDRDRDRGGYSPPPSSRPADQPPGERKSYWMDVLFFRRLIAPTIIMILFWINVASVLLSSLVVGVMGLLTLFDKPLGGIVIILGALLNVPFGILVARLFGEMLIVVFRMYESLQSLNEKMEQQPQKKESDPLR